MMVDSKSTGISGRDYSIDKVDFGIINRLLSYCQEHHKLCATRSTIPIVDLQVIDCHSGHIIPFPGNAAYVAVNYVWGATECTSNSNSNGSLWSRAPKTIMDTMTLALQLGISHIWVDRYCIPQDDED
ncbi:hypothetical protein EJ08DRAFT_719736 [Tothia fuscella]|uniref:Heterokaryon incompatibility domain-containing protein n=1 Tax=Tothia fuscella TaxID=1048955 RepID=A0A9P4NMB4_9PEZI|nr:hypothetical protein EJ08DRAFT_719736 [Tothia fuscella]